jgi:hypothetical protein
MEPEGHFHVRKSSLTILSQMNPVYTTKPGAMRNISGYDTFLWRGATQEQGVFSLLPHPERLLPYPTSV